MDAVELNYRDLLRACDEYEVENQELRGRITSLLNNEDYRKEAVSKEVFDKVRWCEQQVAAQAIEIAKLNRALAESVEACHALRKQIESDDR